MRDRGCGMNHRPPTADDLPDIIAAFDALRATPAPPFPGQPEPDPVTPLDLTRDGGVFVTDSSPSLRECSNRTCRHAIHVGHPRINYRPTATSAVTYYFHPACVVVPKGQAND